VTATTAAAARQAALELRWLELIAQASTHPASIPDIASASRILTRAIIGRRAPDADPGHGLLDAAETIIRKLEHDSVAACGCD